MTAVELVRLKPKPGAKERLLEIRPTLLEQYRKHYQQFEAELTTTEDGSWIDIWTWEDRSFAEEALADTSRFPAFEEWVTLVDLESVTWTEVTEVIRP